jgi:PAS domain S-box-containing protein
VPLLDWLTALGPTITPSTRRRTWFVVATAVAMFALVFVARERTANVNDSVGILYVWPIVWVAVELGILPGLICAVVAYLLFGAWIVTEDIHLSALGFLARAAVFFPTAFVVGSIAGRLRGALDAARQSEERIGLLISSAGDAVISADEDSRIMAWNPAAENMFGWAAADVLGKDIAEVAIPERLRKVYSDNLRRFLDAGDRSMIGRRFEFRGLHRDGHEFPIEMTVSAVDEPGGWIFNAFANDISDRKRTEDVRQQLATIVDASDDAIYSYGLDGRILTWNSGAERMFGYSAEEAIGLDIARLTPADRPDDATAILDRVRKGEYVKNFETVRMGKEGRRVEVTLAVSPTIGEGGKVTGASSIARDISTRKRKDAYQAAENRATRVLASAGASDEVAATILPIVGDVGDWMCGAYWVPQADSNRLRCERTWTAPEIRTQVEVLAEGSESEYDDGEIRTPVWETGDSSPSPLPCAEEAALRGMQTRLWLPIVASNELLGAFQLFDRRTRERDEDLMVTMAALSNQIANYQSRRRAEEQVERAKDEFFAMVSHELRTPLTSIIGYSDLLAEDEAQRLTEEGRGYLDIVRRNADRELRLVTDLLLLVRIQEGTFELELEPTDLRRIVDEGIQAARPVAERREITIAGEMDETPPLMGDPHRLGQVVDNLLSNAIKFTPPGGRIDVRLGARNGSAELEIADDGIGISEDDLMRLFDRLYRASSAREAQIPGLGLGLTIVRAIVEAHEGTIRVESTEGSGTKFRVDLPL